MRGVFSNANDIHLFIPPRKPSLQASSSHYREDEDGLLKVEPPLIVNPFPRL